MCRMPRLLATCAVLALLAQSAAALAADAKPQPQAAAPAALKPASAQDRMEAQRLPALGRAAFWAREVDIDARDPVAGANLANALRALGRIDEVQDILALVADQADAADDDRVKANRTERDIPDAITL